MCLIMLSWQPQQETRLIVAANRDEFFSRPTESAHYWPDAPHIFAGRDKEFGGSWMGLSRAGRFAAVTNLLYARRTFDGQIIGAYLLMYAGVRSVTETYRGDIARGFFLPQLLGESLSFSQGVSVLVALGIVGALVWRSRNPVPTA